jgi:hydroxymethylbilane synthase
VNKEKIVIGTRGSKLALYQAERVKSELERHYPDLTAELKIIKTKGDKILDVALSKIGDKGLFTKEIEIALLNGDIDIAVHSLKDLPTMLPEGMVLGGVLERGEIRDALVSRRGKKLADLTSNDVIATSSLRRSSALLRYNKDLNIIDIRGNVNSRLEKMENGYCDAMIMAATGLERLGLDKYITEYLDPEVIIPAVSQGAIALEIRENDTRIQTIVDGINHYDTLNAVLAERAFLRTLQGGCQVPVGCYSVMSNDVIELTGIVSSLDGNSFVKSSITGSCSNTEELGVKLAEDLIDKGAETILTEIRDHLNSNA